MATLPLPVIKDLRMRSGLVGIVGGGLLASATTPLLGAVLAAYCITKGIHCAFVADKNKKLITHSGCVAHVLQPSDFRDYRRQIGDEQVLLELQYADEEGMPLSIDATEFLSQYMSKPESPKKELPFSSTSVALKSQSQPVQQASTSIVKLHDPMDLAIDRQYRLTRAYFGTLKPRDEPASWVGMNPDKNGQPYTKSSLKTRNWEHF